MSLLTFKSGGVHPPEHKELSLHKAIVDVPLSRELVIHMNQHLGKPAKVIVKVKDEVKVGDILGEADGMISAFVHASASGVVKKIEKRMSAAGMPEMSVTLEVNAEKTAEDLKAFEQLQDISLDAISGSELIEKIKQAGIVGAGGATFPVHVKLCPPKDKRVDTLVLNGAECEPFLTADHQLMLEHADGILKGAKVLQKILNVPDVVIGIEENKRDAIRLLTDRIQALGYKGFRVAPLQTRYPQGGEKQLIWAILKRSVPSTKLPFETGVVVQNVATAFAVFEAIYYNKPVFERVVTLSGQVNRPGNYRIKVGTSFQEAIAAVGGFKDEARVGAILNGGPMMGKTIRELDVTTMKGTSGILVFSEDDVALEKEGPCIRCGRCVKVCPMGLVPTELAQSAQFKQPEQLVGDVMDCMECGCCSYVCPTRRKLVHWIRIGKMVLRNHQRSKA